MAGVKRHAHSKTNCHSRKAVLVWVGAKSKSSPAPWKKGYKDAYLLFALLPQKIRLKRISSSLGEGSLGRDINSNIKPALKGEVGFA